MSARPGAPSNPMVIALSGLIPIPKPTKAPSQLYKNKAANPTAVLSSVLKRSLNSELNMRHRTRTTMTAAKTRASFTAMVKNCHPLGAYER